MAGFTVDRVERLEESPYDPGADQAWWEADVRTDEDGPLTVKLWTTSTDEHAFQGDPEERVREELERLSRLYELDILYALSPIQLRPEN